MRTSVNLRFSASLLTIVAFAILSPSALAQSTSSGGKGGGSIQDGDDPITYYGAPHGPAPTPEPFTMVLGAGAVGLYARRRYVRSRKPA